MFTRHISRRLAAHLDGQLSQPKAEQTELHLAAVPASAGPNACEQVARGGMRAAGTSSVGRGAGCDMVLHRGRVSAGPIPAGASGSPMALGFRGNRSVGAGRRLPGTGALADLRSGSKRTGKWCGLDGSPLVGAKPIQGAGRIGAGEWIETDARSRATVKVGEIGSVEIAPNTRVRVVTARPDEHRLALARGEIRAKISAPPRLFFVDTASGTAVDLGCEYELSTDEEGSGLLHVTRGWVSFQWKGLESLVPAGASCRTRPRDRTGAYRTSTTRQRASSRPWKSSSSKRPETTRSARSSPNPASAIRSRSGTCSRAWIPADRGRAYSTVSLP